MRFMMKDLKLYRYGFLLFCFIFAANSAIAQDLGSSNSLFDPPKTKSANKPTPKKNVSKPKTPTTAKKAASKPKPATAQNKDKTAEPKTTDTKNDSKPQQAAVKKASKPSPQENIVITVGNPTPTKENFDELFEQAIAQGNVARDEREYTKAEAAYLRAQSLKTSDSRAIYGLGNIYSDQQRWEEAERAYRTAIQLEPNAPESYIALSFVLTQPIIGMELSERYAEAEKLARQAINLDAGNALAYDQLGVALELQGKISDETQSAYKKAIKLDSTNALAYAHLGRLLRRKGLINESSAAYRDSIRLATDVPTMILVADVMQSQQRYTESEQLLRRALRDDPRNPTALYLLGRALTTRGSFDEAEKVLKKSAEVSPNSFTSYALLGSLFVRREQYDEAEKYLMKASRMVSPNEKKHLAQEFESLGDGYQRAGKSKEAARAYRQAAEFDKENTTLNEKLAKIQVK